MSLSTVFLPRSEDDIAAIHSEYEMQFPGLGHRFTQSLLDAVTRLQWMPEGYGEVAAGIRAAPLRKSPYGIY